MSARNLFVLVAGAGLALGVAACDNNAKATAPTATSTAAAKPAATTAAAKPAATTASAKPAGTKATTTPTAKATTKATTEPASTDAMSACPVSEKTLLAALRKRDPKGSLGASLSDIKCYRGYAFGSTPSGPVADGEQILFQYKSGSWVYVSGGSGGYCDHDLPAGVEKHFGCD
ncbi:hypothetical protein ACTOB_004110 [Actinoplanes oblitus]|uniref:Lipoprotein n=1 Tax=Actinoplanes oblitus TaxID=3040509 RepID=A0ABY8WRC6_9ACTN|nr:hypothetical protein [Actinoplanes oblitus]WIN00406.1 hypothetical protein ACTOB_004110 [Actinoplanes oblitus]